MLRRRWKKGGDDCGNDGHNGTMAEDDSLKFNVKCKGSINGGNTKGMKEIQWNARERSYEVGPSGGGGRLDQNHRIQGRINGRD